MNTETSNPAADSFAEVAAQIPDTVHQDTSQTFGNPSPPQQPQQIDPAIKYPQWTPPEVATQFGATFFAIEMFRGPHWQIQADKLAQIGDKFCPIFQRHVPYGTGAPGWIQSVMMWLGAAFVLKEAVGPALKEEMRLAKLAKLKQQQQKDSTAAQSSTGSMQTEESGGSSSSQGSEGPASPIFKSPNSVDVQVES